MMRLTSGAKPMSSIRSARPARKSPPVEGDVALLHEIEQTARRGHDNFNPREEGAIWGCSPTPPKMTTCRSGRWLP